MPCPSHGEEITKISYPVHNKHWLRVCGNNAYPSNTAARVLHEDLMSVYGAPFLLLCPKQPHCKRHLPGLFPTQMVRGSLQRFRHWERHMRIIFMEIFRVQEI